LGRRGKVSRFNIFSPFNNILRTNPSANLEKALGENILAVIGKPKFQQLIEFKADCPKVKVTGYVTKTIISGSMNSSKISKDQNFFFLNRRPIDIPRRFKTLFADMYKQYNPSMNPILILNLDVEDNNYDINVSPDKREVFIKNEEEVIEHLREILTEFFEDIQRTKAYDCQSVAITQKSIKSHFTPHA
jgi:DNA mismatch repair protein PMS2